jgi:hypothetical protein
VVELSPRSVYDPAYEKMRREAVQRWTGIAPKMLQPQQQVSGWFCADRRHLMPGTLAEEFAQVRWQSRRE